MAATVKSVYNRPGISRLIDEALVKYKPDSPNGKAALARLQQVDPDTYGKPPVTITAAKTGNTAFDTALAATPASPEQPQNGFKLTPGDQVKTGATTTSTASGLVDNESIKTITQILEKLSSKGTETVTRGDAASNDILKQIIAAAPNFLSKFSKENAIADSQGAVNATVTEILNRGIPGINNESTIAGGYNDTVTKLLRDNLVSQAAGEGAKVQQTAIKNYGDITTSGANALSGLVAANQSGTATSTSTQDQVSNTDNTSDETRNLQRILNDLNTRQDFATVAPTGVVTGGSGGSKNAGNAELLQLMALFQNLK